MWGRGVMCRGYVWGYGVCMWCGGVCGVDVGCVCVGGMFGVVGVWTFGVWCGGCGVCGGVCRGCGVYKCRGVCVGLWDVYVVCVWCVVGGRRCGVVCVLSL